MLALFKRLVIGQKESGKSYGPVSMSLSMSFEDERSIIFACAFKLIFPHHRVGLLFVDCHIFVIADISDLSIVLHAHYCVMVTLDRGFYIDADFSILAISDKLILDLIPTSNKILCWIYVSLVAICINCRFSAPSTTEDIVRFRTFYVRHIRLSFS
ncbi:hypothetical protein BCR37DRAFT_381848 [Protomyces lactucae-debilis]|uniref:Uncharacterized protein n=1 Tax=Protomyces lactucae-debilis TaxID=2754530 RepID=A0A1Y2F665_PROLT|nr:uncharacterized protein BCR37DRAFT_381848 [Protomyces lactucae-debilis]ORY78974.1 hypothetical protein BCR37DRAFT_381848 [Protomyces lactucae-debilis]